MIPDLYTTRSLPLEDPRTRMVGVRRQLRSAACLCLAVLAAVVLSQSSPAEQLTVDLRVGITHGEHSLDAGADQRALGFAMRVLRDSTDLQNQHLMGWGALNPEPAPGQSAWESLDERITLISRSGGEPVLTLCCAPDWMKGGEPGTTDWSRLEVAPTPDHYDDFAALAARAAARYPDVRYFQVWNELKGFYDQSANRWDAAAYTDLYNRVHAAVKAVRPDALIGGPYVVMDSWSQGGSHPSAIAGPWGVLDQRPLDVLEYWLRHARDADFVVVDGKTATRDRGVITDPFTAVGKFAAVNAWLRQRTTLPIWWAEWSAVPQRALRNLDYQAAVQAAGLRSLALSGAAVALSWQPQAVGSRCDGCLWSDAHPSGGSRPTPFASVLSAWRRMFRPGSVVRAEPAGLPSELIALESDQGVFVINPSRELVHVRDTAPLAAYEVRATTVPSTHKEMSCAPPL